MNQYSFSKLNSFHTCPYGYYLNYIAKKESANNAFAQYGTFNHSILEKYTNGELAIYELLDYYQDNFDKEVTLEFPPNKYVDLHDTYYNDGLNYYSNFDGFDDYKVIGAEIEFVECIDNRFNLKGYIDLVLEDQNQEIIIVDHKSKAKFTSKREQEHYAIQLYLYCIYIKNKFGKFPKSLVFNMFRKQNIVTIPFNNAEFEKAKRWMVESVNLIERVLNKLINTQIDVLDCFYSNPNKFFCTELCGCREHCNQKEVQC